MELPSLLDVPLLGWAILCLVYRRDREGTRKSSKRERCAVYSAKWATSSRCHLEGNQIRHMAQVGSIWQDEEAQEGEAEQAQEGQALVLPCCPMVLPLLLASLAPASGSSLPLSPGDPLCTRRTSARTSGVCQRLAQPASWWGVKLLFFKLTVHQEMPCRNMINTAPGYTEATELLHPQQPHPPSHIDRLPAALQASRPEPRLSVQHITTLAVSWQSSKGS